ncbi:hypothetical protein HDC34_003204 [Pseudoclavibacter sp. JAI123]|uniref:hypothetical protein n=1 Tax=Pseudoclavibacter sp. JAI123 TaxID=2723065 RepID=UPI0015C947EF|nr:hypothetical protein [Pseudoclavibacter sp. JAI123]NYF14869.1 hypothetical protein [Pseudoclavibacter sp. JAI123]
MSSKPALNRPLSWAATIIAVVVLIAGVGNVFLNGPHVTAWLTLAAITIGCCAAIWNLRRRYR